MQSHDSPLGGIRVLDFTQNLPGPYATFTLLALGAEVTKVEPPSGDPARAMEPFFTMLNRGKRSVVLDLRDPASRPALRALVERADVLVEGFRPGVMARLGCDAATARAWNPRLIYCSVSAWGQSGPRVDEPAHDLNVQASTGVCHLERDARSVPRGTVLPIADLSTSMMVVASVCGALVARDAEGEGATLDIAMCDALLSWVQIWGDGIDLAGQARRTLGERGARLAERVLLRNLERLKLYALPQYGVYRAGDGRHLTLGVVGEPHFWRRACNVLGLARFGGLSMPALAALSPVMSRLVARRLRRAPAAMWIGRFRAAGVPASEVHDGARARRDPHFVHRGLVGPDGLVRPAVAQAAHVTAPAPDLGADTGSVLASLDLDGG